MKKGAPFLLILVLALLLFGIRRCQQGNSPRERSSQTTGSKSRGFNRDVSLLSYTQHARCRMQCRQISEEDIEEVMLGGKINYKKSDVNDRPCPVYAVQGYTRDREHLQVIFGQCGNTTRVITCYNLEEEFRCDCPGDEKKR